jgi:hypothetical protein
VKWAIARILIAVVLAFQFQIAVWMWPQNASPAQATQPTADVIITYSVIVEIGPASNFILTDLGFISVGANWSAGSNATYYMIRGSRTAFPTSIIEGELLYYDTGTSCNVSGVPLDTITMYASLWSFQADNVTYAPGYVTASIGGEGMTEIADSINALSVSLGGLNFDLDLSLMFGVILVISMLFLALWRKDKEANVETSIVFLIVSGLVTLYIALSWIDAYQGIAIVFVGLAGFQLFEAVRMTMVAGGPSKGLSQFKGWLGKFKGKDE